MYVSIDLDISTALYENLWYTLISVKALQEHVLIYLWTEAHLYVKEVDS